MSLNKMFLLALAVSMPAVSAFTFAKLREEAVNFSNSKKGISTITVTTAVAFILKEAYRTLPANGVFANHCLKMCQDAISNPASNPVVFLALVGGTAVPTICGAKHVYNKHFSLEAKIAKKAAQISVLKIAPADEKPEAKTAREAKLTTAEAEFAALSLKTKKVAKENPAPVKEEPVKEEPAKAPVKEEPAKAPVKEEPSKEPAQADQAPAPRDLTAASATA